MPAVCFTPIARVALNRSTPLRSRSVLTVGLPAGQARLAPGGVKLDA